MKTKGLHISQVTFLPTLLDSLKGKGVTTGRMIKKSKLDRYDLSNCDGYIPSLFLYDFLEQVQTSQGLYSIAGTFFEDFSLVNAGSFGEGLFVQPTLLELMQGGIKYQHLLRTDNILDFQVVGNKMEFYFNMHGKPSKHKTILEDIALAQTLHTFRVAGGENWFPPEIHLTAKNARRLDKLLLPGNYRLFLNQPFNKIVFPLELVFKDLLPNENDLELNLDPTNTLTSQIHRLLKNTAAGFQLNFNQLVEISNMSPRTLSRRLTEEGTSFKQIASNVNLGKATQLLTTTNLSVKEIAQQLGYARSDNFIRAFKSVTKLTPDLYRAQC